MAPETGSRNTVKAIELVRLIESNQCIIKDNTAAMFKVAEANLESAKATAHLADVVSSLQQVVTLLVTQVTTNIAQRNDAVPLKVFMLVVGTLVLILAAIVGLDMGGYHVVGVP